MRREKPTLTITCEKERLISIEKSAFLLVLEHSTTQDLVRIAELLKIYRDANIGFVDASVVAIAERLKISGVLTTDRRHFETIKPQHCKEFRLLP